MSGWGPYVPPGFHMIWGWRIAAAIFLTALGSMTMLLAAFYDVRGKAQRMVKINMVTGWVFILAALAFFIIDLGQPPRAGNIILIGYPNGRLAQSWMAWGVMFLGGMVIWGLIFLVIFHLPWATSKLVRSLGLARLVRPTRLTLDYLVMITGIAATVYTAFLFAAAGGKSYWWNGTLPILWLSSGLGYGTAFSLLVARFFYTPGVKTDGGAFDARRLIHELGWVDLLAVIFEGFSWALFLTVAYANHYEARIPLTQLLLQTYAPYFWGFVITLGIAIPLLLEIALFKVDPMGTFAKWAILVIFIAVMLGGYMLRYIVMAVAYYHAPFTPLVNAEPQWGPWWG
ncbi:MAG: NrfD/PsrC family molybdoenzyme membrane anchor subunit [Caldivirga sp.]